MDFLGQDDSLERVLQLTACISLVGIIIAACEQCINVHHYADDGLLSWQVSKYQGRWSIKGWSAKVADYVFGAKGFRWFLFVYLSVSVAAFVLAIANVWLPILWFILAVIFMGLNLRSAFGLDGAHQMNLIVLIALCVATYFSSSAAVQEICLGFIAIQLMLSYVIAGYWKLCSKTWRDGSALVGIFSTDIYGNPFLYRMFAKHRQVSRFTGWVIILFECSFPIAFFLNFKVLGVYLFVGLIFHLGTAIYMGLNSFLFAFVSAYPALFYVSANYGLYLS